MASYLDNINKTISSELLVDKRICRIASEQFPELQSKLKSNSYSLADLLEVNEFISQQRNVERNNCMIALRLVGGLSVYCSKSEIDPESVLSAYDNEEYQLVIDAFLKSFSFSSSWFREGRAFFTDHQVAHFRRQNVEMLFQYVNDYQSFIGIVHESIAPKQNELRKVLSGSHSVHSSFVCRQIERIVKLKEGSLDKKPARFDVVLSDWLASI